MTLFRNTTCFAAFILLFIPQLWAQEFELSLGGQGIENGYSVAYASDNNIIIASSTTSYGAGSEDILLTKLTPSGTVLWSKTFGGSGNDFPRSVIETSDFGFLVVGSTYSFSSGNKDIYVVKTDADGELQWSIGVGGNQKERGFSAAEDINGYIVCGSAQSTSHGLEDAYFFKVNYAGNLIWTAAYGGTARDNCFDIEATIDGNFVFTGAQESYGAGGFDFFIGKISGDGDLLWAKSIGAGNQDHPRSIREMSDGSLVIVGHTLSWSSGNYDPLVIKTNTDGNIDWARTWGGSGNEWSEGLDISSTSDDIYLSGFTESYGSGGSDIFTYKINSDGNLIWAVAFGGSDTDRIPFGGNNSVSLKPDGGVLICGQSSSYAIGSPGNIYLISANNLGLTNCNDIPINPDTYNATPSSISLSINRLTGGNLIQANTITTDVIIKNEFICSNPPSAGFTTDKTTICQNECISFQDTSVSDITQWEWRFEGASQAYSYEQHPQGICYNVPGTYNVSLKVWNNFGVDSVITTDYITVVENPFVQLPSDTALCIGDTLWPKEHSSDGNFLWSTGATTEFIQIHDPGLYWLEIANSFGCANNDSAEVEIKMQPIVNLGNDTSLLPNTYILLDADNPGANYLWSTNDTSQIIYAYPTDLYWVNVELDGCMAFDSIYIYEEIPCNVGVPTAFTPNNDNWNDVLRIRGDGFDDVELSIFNRWGEKVFQSTSTSNVWDGTYKGSLQNTGVFQYILKVRCMSGEKIVRKGSITLLR